jgi:glycosyltransferase involved in cell wall biosynthesis
MRHVYSWHVNKVVAVSSGVKKALVSSGVSKTHIEVIHSGIDIERFDRRRIKKNFRATFNIAENRKVIGLIASFNKRKGHRYALMAMPKIIQAVPRALLVLVGDGPLGGELKNAAGQLGIEDNVLFMGFQRRIPEILAGLDLLLLPSLSEGLGISLLEGMSMELPVVASNVGGIPESVHNNINGFLVPERNPDALADRCVQILINPELSNRMGREGRKIVQRQFSANVMAEKYHALYKRLLRDKAG